MTRPNDVCGDTILKANESQFFPLVTSRNSEAFDKKVFPWKIILCRL